MKILCLTTRLDRPSTRYRLLQFLPYINSSGIETEVVVIPKGINPALSAVNNFFGAGKGWVKRWGIFERVSGYDAVFIQKKLLSRMEQWYLRKKAKRIFYDFDDAIMYTKSKYSKNTRRYKRFRYMMDISDLIIAGNKYLAEIADGRYVKKVTVIPTVVDVSKYPLHSQSNSDFTIGWIGTKSTQGYLKIIRPAIEKLIKKYPNLKVKIISDKKPQVCGKNIIWEEWNKEKELEQLVSFDIGLMPLTLDPWTRGKCGFKIIQYMASGIPVVCSPVGVNTEIVKNGINGFFASTTQEWENSISRLIEDLDLYKKMSVESRATIEKNYNLNYWGPYSANLLKEKLC